MQVCCEVTPRQDLGLGPTHAALSPDGSYLLLGGSRTEVTTALIGTWWLQNVVSRD